MSNIKQQNNPPDALFEKLKQLLLNKTNLSVNASSLIVVVLAWSLLVRDQGFLDIMPLNLRLFFIAILIVITSHFYRNIKFKFVANIETIFVVLANFVFIISVNGPYLGEAITGDELYHVGRSSIALDFLENFLQRNPSGTFAGWFKHRPLTEVIPLIYILGFSATVFCYYVIRKFTHRLPSRLSKTFTFMALVGVLFLIGSFSQLLPGRSEVHPPFRLFPLFVAPLFAGYDDIAFRLVSVLALTFSSYLIFRILRFRLPFLTAWFASIFLCLLPPLASHLGSIVEPSIWAFFAWISVFYLLSSDSSPGQGPSENTLVKCGIVVAICTLMRQNCIVLWLPIGLCLLVYKHSLRCWLLTALPGAWTLPYLIFVKKNHFLTPADPLANISEALFSGIFLEHTTRALTPVWLGLLAIFAFIFTYKRLWIKEKASVVLISIIPAFCLYYSISPSLWPLGRYYGEWILPTAIILGAILIRDHCVRFKRSTIVLALAIGAYSIQATRTLHKDHVFETWMDRRITTESLFPYREALQNLLQRDAGGRFIFVGGVPVNGEWFLALRGFSLQDIHTFRDLQKNLEAWSKESKTSEEFVDRLRQNGVYYVVVQSGNRRETLHRAVWQDNANFLLERLATLDKGEAYSLKRDRFYGELEGTIDIFQIKK